MWNPKAISNIFGEQMKGKLEPDGMDEGNTLNFIISRMYAIGYLAYNRLKKRKL